MLLGKQPLPSGGLGVAGQTLYLSLCCSGVLLSVLLTGHWEGLSFFLSCIRTSSFVMVPVISCWQRDWAFDYLCLSGQRPLAGTPS